MLAQMKARGTRWQARACKAPRPCAQGMDTDEAGHAPVKPGVIPRLAFAALMFGQLPVCPHASSFPNSATTTQDGRRGLG